VVACGHVTVREIVGQAPDELAASEVHVAVGFVNDLMSEIGKSLSDGHGDGRFEADLKAALHLPSWCIASGLRILMMVDHAKQGLHMTLRLHIAAHDAEAHLRRAVSGEKCGDDGVEGAFARGHHIGVIGFETKTASTIL